MGDMPSQCQLHMYLRQRGIDYHLRYLVESQYAFRVAEQENLVTEHGIAPMLACLSARLRDNLRHTLHDRLLQCHVILRIRANRDDKFNLELCRLVHMHVAHVFAGGVEMDCAYVERPSRSLTTPSRR